MALVKLENSSSFDSEIKEGIVLVDFYADWCGPCKMIAPVLEKIASEVNDVKILKVNVDEHNDLASRFGVMSIPTLIVFKNGESIEQKLGFMSAEQIMSMINNAK